MATPLSGLASLAALQHRQQQQQQQLPLSLGLSQQPSPLGGSPLLAHLSTTAQRDRPILSSSSSFPQQQHPFPAAPSPLLALGERPLLAASPFASIALTSRPLQTPLAALAAQPLQPLGSDLPNLPNKSNLQSQPQSAHPSGHLDCLTSPSPLSRFSRSLTRAQLGSRQLWCQEASAPQQWSFAHPWRNAAGPIFDFSTDSPDTALFRSRKSLPLQPDDENEL